MRVYYMTSAKWGEVILKERRLKLSRFYESNDPFELMLIDIRPQDTRKIAKIISDYYHKNVGMICFGSGWSSPVMWAHYAEKHTGICFGFDVDDKLVSSVNYTDEKIAVPFGSHLPRFGLSEELLTKIVATKANDWEYEREYRVMGRLVVQDPTTGLYYTEFGPQIKLREVIIGHRCTWTAESVRKLIGKTEVSVRIYKARPAFGKFEMVEQKSFKRLTIAATKHRS
jgi:hypothetical protein